MTQQYKQHIHLMLMKVFSHPGHGNSKCCIVVSFSWICFTSHQRGFFCFLLTGEELQVSNPAWEFPYKVDMAMFELRVSESLLPLVSRWPFCVMPFIY